MTLLGWCSALLLAAAAGDEADVVFVIDSSGSMARNDPAGFRTDLAAALSGGLGRGEGARFSVIQFAGWNESADKDMVLLVRDPDPAKVAGAAGRISPSGEASDLNAALERGLPRILEERRKAGGRGPVFVVILTDGEFDVVEEKVRPEYEAIAKREFAGQYRSEADAALRRAALVHYEKEVLPKFGDVPIHFTGVDLGKGAGEDFKKVVEGGRRPGRILGRRDRPLRDTLAPLLAEGPSFRRGQDAFYGYEAKTEASWTQPLTVFEGSREVRIWAWSGSADYEVRVEGLAARTDGAGRRHRLLLLESPPAGVYEVRVASKGGSPVEILAQVRSGLGAFAKRKGEGEAALGEKQEVEAGLADAQGRAVEAPRLAPFLKGEATLVVPGGEPKKEPVELRDGKPAAHAFTIPADGPEGEYAIEFRYSAALPKGLPGLDVLEGKAPAVKFRARGIYEASFDRGEAWVGQEVRVIVKPSVGKPGTSGPYKLALKGPGSPVLDLAYDLAAGQWKGPFRPASEGAWSIGAGVSEKVRIVPGKVAEVRVKPRALRLLQDGRPVEKLIAEVKYSERGEYRLDVRAEVDRDPGEEASFEARFEGVPGVGYSWPGPLRIDTDAALSEKAGQLGITARVAGQAVEGRFPVELRFPDRGAKLFRRSLPFLAAILLAALLVAAWCLLHRFTIQEIRPLVKGNLDQAYPLREWKQGLAGRKAVGTPEVQGAVRFLLSGMKGISKPRCRVEAAREGVQVFVNGLPPEQRGALRHADEVKVAEQGQEWVYYYFEYPPTPEELKALLQSYDNRDSLYIVDE
jgi:hypothetical protein